MYDGWTENEEQTLARAAKRIYEHLYNTEEREIFELAWSMWVVEMPLRERDEIYQLGMGR